MTTQQPEALRLADWLEGFHRATTHHEAAAELRRQHARITALESQLAQRFDAADMATAAAQGFRDGVSSVSAVSEPVAWQYRSVRDKGLWFDCTEERAQQRAAHPDKWDVRYLYTHPSPPGGMGAAKEQQAGAFQRALSIRTAQGWKLGGDKVPVLYTDEINGEQVCRDDVWLCTTAALASPPTAQAGSEPVASCAIRLLVAADLITQAKANEALRLAAEITAAPATADGESK